MSDFLKCLKETIELGVIADMSPSQVNKELNRQHTYIKKLEQAMCVYAKEYLDNMCFECDQDVINYFMDLTNDS